MHIRSTFSEGLESELPSSLPMGYPYYASDTKRLFVGRGDTTPPEAIKSDLEWRFDETIGDLVARMTTAENTLATRIGDVGIKNVDETEIADGKVLYYDQVNDVIRYADPSIFNGLDPNPLKQVTLYNVVASPTIPYNIYIDIPKTLNFNRHPLEVLKFRESQDNVITVATSYTNGDAIDFIPNKYIKFDGAMKLQTEYFLPYNVLESTAGGQILETSIFRLDEFKKVERLDVTGGAAGDVIRSLLHLDTGYYSFINNEWIKVSDTLPTRTVIEAQGMADLSVVTTPTTKARFTLQEDTSYTGAGKIYRKQIDVSMYGAISRVDVVR